MQKNPAQRPLLWLIARVVRGGSWNNNPVNLRSANRNHNAPGDHNNNVGFRLARTARLIGLRPASAPLGQIVQLYAAAQRCFRAVQAIAG